jgi:hypothetical protein
MAACQPVDPAPAGQEPPADNAEPSAEASQEPPLEDHEVARINDTVITADIYHHYLSLVYARMPEGDTSLEQLLLEELLRSRAAEFDVSVGESEVDVVYAELEARVREQTNGQRGLLDQVGGAEQAEELHKSVRLATLHRKLVAQEHSLASMQDVDDAMLKTWLDEALASAALEEAPLDEPAAATWSGGTISRVSVGARIAQLLSPDIQAGLLTELLGIHAIREKAAQLGVVLTPEAAADELLEREGQVAGNPTYAGVTYADIVKKINRRETSELVASPKFGAEVLLSLMVTQNWTEVRLIELFEAERPLFEERLGGQVSFAQARFAVLKEVRQRTYIQLLDSSTIVRRF